MLARLSLPFALLSAACAGSTPLDPEAAAAARPAADSWLEHADAAEARGEASAALRALERWAAEDPQRADRDHWVRRLRLSRSAGDEQAMTAATTALLEDSAGAEEAERFAVAELIATHGDPHAAAAAFDVEFQDPVLRLRALRRRAAALEQAEEWSAAAATLERAAADPGAGASARGWWEHASWLWERAGDHARAVRAIALALEGTELGAREQAALARLRAFELGEIGSVEDARATLRFHDDAELRLAAVRYLAARRFPDEVSAFGRVLSDPDGRVIAVALEQLAARFTAAERGYVAACARALVDDPRAEVRREALALLGASGGEADVPHLLDALDPADRAQFRIARRGLESLTGHRPAAPLDPDLAGREALRSAWLAWWRERGAPR